MTKLANAMITAYFVAASAVTVFALTLTYKLFAGVI